MAKQEVAEAPKSALPAYLQGAAKTHKVGNVDTTDLIIPRVKLMQVTSPELDAFNNAKKGEFWHTIANESMGSVLRAVPIIMRKSWVLWAPRGDDRGVLARANDGLNWDNANMEFTVKPKLSPTPVTYKLGTTVHDKIGDAPALSEFGSSIPGDKNSPPAAALTYQFLWYFLDYKDFSPAIIINTRSSVKPAKSLLSKIDLRPVEHYAQVYNIQSVKASNAAGDEFYNYNFIADGYADEDMYNLCKELYNNFEANKNWRANDEGEDTDGDNVDGAPKGRSGGKSDSDKF